MRRYLFLLLASAGLIFAADDPWTAVTKLKSGTEIRVIKKGSVTPIVGKIDEATDERLVLVVKNSQTAIAKDQIDRVDARPGPGDKKTKVTTTTKTNDPQAAQEPEVGMNVKPPTPGSSTSTGISIGGDKPDFETVYRRPPGAPKSVTDKK